MLFTISPSAMPEGYGEALVSLEAARQWLRVDTDEEDALIAALRDAAVDLVEQYTGLYLGPRTGLVATFQSFASERRPGFFQPAPEAMRLGRGPIATLAVTGIAYVDRTGAAASIAAGGWRIDQGGGLLPPIGTCWPSCASAVAVTFDVGFAAGECPPTLISAVKLMTNFLYLNRDAAVSEGLSGDIPPGVCMLCNPFRLPVI